MKEQGTLVDNAVIEFYCRSIKRQLIISNKHKKISEMKMTIEKYLIDYYPNKHIHTVFKMT